MEAQAAHLFLKAPLGWAQMRNYEICVIKSLYSGEIYQIVSLELKYCNDDMDLSSCIIFINIHEYTNKII